MEAENTIDQPLLISSTTEDHQSRQHDQLQPLLRPKNPSSFSFTPRSDDIPSIDGVRDFFREFCRESKKLWYLAGPAIFTSLCRYSLGAVTQVFAGQVDTLTLAAVSVENSVIAGFSFGVMVYNKANY
ncbi:hypothetical protein TIFTF001_010753 [Ficus carica]|uniref:Multi antimicrobial extrusion protein n=1 Tax=Ficus carica TaxID=3494 RepID=A0AA88A959_FICCA|nr:hypothetical protein TIFTF001_010753 [Ficus carica]